jgi:hypothetical protein
MVSSKGLTEEIREALAAAAPGGLSSAELVARCSCADSASAVSKIIYAMRQSGEVVSEAPPSGEGRHVHRLVAVRDRPAKARTKAARKHRATAEQAAPKHAPRPQIPAKPATAYRLSEHLDQLALDAEDVIGEALSRDADADLIRCLVTVQGAIHRAARRALTQELSHV